MSNDRSFGPSQNDKLFQPTGMPSVRRFSEAEIQKRREKGLCFKCDEKYYFGHVCKNKELQILILEEEEEVSQIEQEEITVVNEEEVVELSLNSVVGITTPKTMKIRGLVGSEEVVVLIDWEPPTNLFPWNW